MKKRVFDKCDQLAEQGIKPTLIRVRSELGGGSFSTINPLLKQWKEEKKMGDNQTTIELRNEITAIHQKTSALIWKAACDYYDNIKQEQQDELTTLRIKVAEADAAVSLLHKRVEEIQQEKTMLERMLGIYSRDEA